MGGYPNSWMVYGRKSHIKMDDWRYPDGPGTLHLMLDQTMMLDHHLGHLGPSLCSTWASESASTLALWPWYKSHRWAGWLGV